MYKLILLFLVVFTIIAESTCQHIIRPTYRPPPGGPVFIKPTYRPNVRPTFIRPTYRPPPKQVFTRTVRQVNNDEPLWLYKGDDVLRGPASGDHPVLPSIIDDIKLDPNRRTARSLSTPSTSRGARGGNRGSSSRNTGPTHPGYNRRNARDIRLPSPYDPFRPSPTIPRPHTPLNPRPGLPYPIYTRYARDVHIPGVQKPTHHDVIIPNWNPNARVNPWQRIGVKPRRIRDTEAEDLELYNQEFYEMNESE